MNFILAVLAFAVAVTAQTGPVYQPIDNECSKIASDGNLPQLVGSWPVKYFTNDGLNCTTVTVTYEDGIYKASYILTTNALSSQYGVDAIFVEDPKHQGHFDVFVNGTLVSTTTIVGLEVGIGYAAVVCDAKKDAKINLKGVSAWGGSQVNTDQLQGLKTKCEQHAPELKLKQVPPHC